MDEVSANVIAYECKGQVFVFEILEDGWEERFFKMEINLSKAVVIIIEVS